MRRVTITHTSRTAGFYSKQSVDLADDQDIALIDLLNHDPMKDLSGMLVKHGDILTITTEPED